MGNQKLTKEINRRRTFAIISHPDAGKTTLTEKLLLYGGAIQVAGAVKSNKIKKTATSDWMEIERQRGISVATSVMGFEYSNLNINILDTPGHQDFAEDTFRTLTAVDSVIVVIDVAKGVEPQTEKLVKVCRMRKTPIIVFINKLDRPGKDGFELLDEVEQKLDLKITPLSWPINMGPEFKGVYNIFDESLYLFEPGKQRIEEGISISNLHDPELDDYLDEDAQMLREELDLIKGVYPAFDRQQYLDGTICPVFFGSALNNFGVKELLDCFIRIAPTPIGRQAEERKILPEEENFSGFVFKIHANMDPNHRDRIAFVRIVSGRFERNKPYHHVRLGRSLKFSNPTAFMAQKKSIVDEAFPGDIVGLYDSGNFKIGDTLTEGELLHYKGIPSFSPELFRYVENADPMKSKQLAKGLDQLMDEGVAQLFTGKATGRKIIGTVGALQFEVIQYRLLHEYGASCRYEPITLYKTAWITSENKAMLNDFKARKASFLAFDKEGRDVFLADSPYALQTSMEKYPDIKFHFTSEF
ncbi:MAG TPA: peptide chain release factor 3 [Bacteroidales bacterium]|jgi:peptide chain release factor 3|nr:peptide chain release factor 3 [Bacteroidales bacterium]HPE42613.1 peptide chain release factor 3 [Bacteroidales bacterium]